MDLSTLRKGDVIRVAAGHGTELRVVVSVVDTTGATGGLVDTKPVEGRYSRSNGFRAGDDVVALVWDAGTPEQIRVAQEAFFFARAADR